MADWFGFKMEEFEFEGAKASVVLPSGEKNGKWLLKTEYRDAFPNFEIEMVKRGWCIAYNENVTRWAIDPEIIDKKARFCAYVSKTYGLSKKCVPVGMSCGGQMAVQLAARYPELVSLIYIDAPVMNYLSCPCGVGIATNRLYNEFVEKTGLTVVDMMQYRNHPIDHAEKLLADKIPVIMVYGDNDYVVPYMENGGVLEQKYRAQGGIIETYGKPGCGHHPHGLEDPTPIISFVEKYA